MLRPIPASRVRIRTAAGLALATLLLAGGADGGAAGNPDLEALLAQARNAGGRALAWYEQTPPLDRVTWGGLTASAVLGLWVLFERSVRLRRHKIIPRDFSARFLERLQDGRLDSGKALDFCEVNRSPAARVALSAVKRWGRPVPDLERAVAMAQRIESDRLRRNVATLRRVAALAPLVGLLGTLLAAGRALNTAGAAWGPAVATALTPLTAGVAIAILSLIAYDGLMGRIESLAGALDRLGAETVDAIAMSRPLEGRASDPRHTIGGLIRTPHQIRIDPSETHSRIANRESDFD